MPIPLPSIYGSSHATMTWPRKPNPLPFTENGCQPLPRWPGDQSVGCSQCCSNGGSSPTSSFSTSLGLLLLLIFHPLPPRWGRPDRRQNRKWLAELFGASSMNIPTAAQRKIVRTGGLLPLTVRFPQGLQERDGKAVFVRFHRGKGWTTKLGRQRPAGHRAQTCKRHLITGCVWRWKERYLPESAPDRKIYFDKLLGEGVVDEIY